MPHQTGKQCPVLWRQGTKYLPLTFFYFYLVFFVDPMYNMAMENVCLFIHYPEKGDNVL